jgi:hypothetical protein
LLRSLTGKGREVWGIDSYLIAIYPAGHALQAETQKGMSYWDRQWQRVKRDAKLTKGYLEVEI